MNDKKDLAEAERLKEAELTDTLMEQGVMICDPSRIDIRGPSNAARMFILM